ncbi:50S ribosomal protein L2 [bacterium CG2_30_37_16]|nr:MAG: 50S ribosomal protein L2 [bacterium CG2_30_37_16]PIP30708.1 MAG: 50S ribosomal protein L2 [bacterium (Candidatus Howlettbacteria) CG23_combo_of_CG06-09_8_20_14_all_37_9]PIX99246.1 MAG: 50S ribosomal protein L2 [bacterium (Candidatus Howlettbacteria) CG_4_10_14_3_um_filter_37_10]PJB05563.1 MAG: 50S ribosomal protein L2 [bacterium (Candidatus Howlettbacteria) CG_4_9_14_3_um_filter_37_10]
MPVVKVKPTTNARRGMTVDTFSDITKIKPEKSLIVPLKKNAGRSYGKITIRHRGGGAKRMYRLIDFKQFNYKNATVESIEYDPNRSARIALISYEGGKGYMVAPQGLKVGAKLEFGEEAEPKAGNRMSLKRIPVGTQVFNVEIYPGRGAQLVRSAGVSAQIVGREEGFIHVRMPSGEIRLINENSWASIGNVSNSEHGLIKVGKAGRKRWMGIRPTVRGKAMNPVDHPHGGGEGGCDIGLIHPKTPWGAPALGYKTRRMPNKMVIRSRKKKR